jgi:hypothetical protein
VISPRKAIATKPMPERITTPEKYHAIWRVARHLNAIPLPERAAV